MKLASLKEGRDGRLIVVSKDMTRAAFGPVATMQAVSYTHPPSPRDLSTSRMPSSA